MKPNIGQKVYCIYEGVILEEEVYALGNDGFIVASFGSMTREDSWEWSYADHGEKWFTTFEEAKEKLLERVGAECSAELIRITDGVWEVAA